MRSFRYLSLLLAFVLLAATACGDDDDDGGGTAGGGGGGDSTEAAAGDDVEAFCSDVLAAEQATSEATEGGGEEGEEGGGEEEGGATTTTVANRAQETTTTTAPAGGGGGEVPPELEEALAAASESAPEEVREDVELIVGAVREGIETGNQEFFDDPEFAEADERVDQFMVEQCAEGASDVTAVDYAFQGFETELPAGQIAFNFTNDGEELHELALARINDDVDQSVEELVQLPEEEVGELITEINFGAFAFPGEGDAELTELEPGRYAMVCFVPVGTTPEVAESGEEPQGEPHALRGMFGEFTVS